MNNHRRSALKAGAALALASALPAWAQAKPTLRFAAVFSDKDIRADMIRMLAKDIEADFRLEPFFNATLFKQGTELVALERDNLEMGNIAPQDGLWFVAGGLGQCRIYSKYLALQIKALEEGLMPRR